MPALRDNRLFVERVQRKLKSFARGLVEAEPGFFVFSPVSVPGRAGRLVSEWALKAEIRRAAARAGIRRPLLWVHRPAGAALLGAFGETFVVLQRTDRFEAFPEADPAVVGAMIEKARAAADLVVDAAPHLMAEEAHFGREQMLIDYASISPGSRRWDAPDGSARWNCRAVSRGSRGRGSGSSAASTRTRSIPNCCSGWRCISLSSEIGPGRLDAGRISL
jgi:hypothetical protein